MSVQFDSSNWIKLFRLLRIKSNEPMMIRNRTRYFDDILSDHSNYSVDNSTARTCFVLELIWSPISNLNHPNCHPKLDQMVCSLKLNSKKKFTFFCLFFFLCTSISLSHNARGRLLIYTIVRKRESSLIANNYLGQVKLTVNRYTCAVESTWFHSYLNEINKYLFMKVLISSNLEQSTKWLHSNMIHSWQWIDFFFR